MKDRYGSLRLLRKDEVMILILKGKLGCVLTTFLMAHLLVGLVGGCTRKEEAKEEVSKVGAPREGGIPRPLKTHEVSFKASAAPSFAPQTLETLAGDTVVWINEDPQPLVIESGTVGPRPEFRAEHDGKFKSPVIPLGGKWSYTFKNPGSYPYYCKARPWFYGEVIARASVQPEAESTTQNY